MPRRRIKKEVPLTRKQISRREKERRQRLILIGIAGVVAALIVIILAYGLYVEYVARPAEPVAVVNGVPVPISTYQKRVLYGRLGIERAIQELQYQRSKFNPEEDQFLIDIIDQQISQISAESSHVNSEGFVDDLIEEELIRQAAAERGIGVSSEEIDRRIEGYYGYDREEPTPSPSPATEGITASVEMTPTEAATPMTKERFEELYGDYLAMLEETIAVSEAEFRDIVETEVLREKMQQAVTEEMPTTEPHIRARHILLASRAEAEVVLKRLEEGEDFATLAEELSQDSSSAQLGGDVGWFPQGKMVPEFDEVAFSLEPGELSGVVETTFGFHIILVEERDENRELDAAMLNQRKVETFEVWLHDLEAEATIEKYWSEEKLPPEE